MCCNNRDQYPESIRNKKEKLPNEIRTDKVNEVKNENGFLCAKSNHINSVFPGVFEVSDLGKIG